MQFYSKKILKKHLVDHTVQSLLLSACMIIVGGLVIWLVLGPSFVIQIGLMLGFLLLISPYVSPKMALTMHQAVVLDSSSAKVVYHLVDTLSDRAQLNIHPQVHYINSREFIAFTVGGTKKPAIALSDGLLLKLNQNELFAVLAHEIAHIKHQDIRIMVIADMMNFIVLSISMLLFISCIISVPLALFGLATIPIIPLLLLLVASLGIFSLRMKLARIREFEADRYAALISEHPEALISALTKLEFPRWKWVETLFYIRKNNPVPKLFRTHPENKERIENLKKTIRPGKINRPIFERSYFGLFVPKHLREIRNASK